MIFPDISFHESYLYENNFYNNPMEQVNRRHKKMENAVNWALISQRYSTVYFKDVIKFSDTNYSDQSILYYPSIMLLSEMFRERIKTVWPADVEKKLIIKCKNIHILNYFTYFSNKILKTVKTWKLLKL